MTPRQRRIRSRRQWAAHRAAVARRAARAWAPALHTTPRATILALQTAARLVSRPYDRMVWSPRALRRCVRVVRGGVRYDPATGRPMAPPK